jgi:hypothetical protein
MKLVLQMLGQIDFVDPVGDEVAAAHEPSSFLGFAPK